MRGIFSVTVENRSGVLSKTAGLFARRGFNIDSLAVGETENSDVSSMTIVSTGDERTIEQVEKQLNKKVDVIKVRRLEEQNCVLKEAVMVKVNYTRTNRKDIMEICSILHGEISYLGSQIMIVSLFGTPEQVADLLVYLRPFGILEVARTGALALQKK